MSAPPPDGASASDSVVMHPFTKPTADVILRSSDGVEFRAHKVILSEASPVFEGMFTLPQPPPASLPGATPDLKDGLPVIPTTETSRVLDHLLRICYPMSNPVFDSVKDVAAVLEAARKYQMDDVVLLMRKLLVDPRFLDKIEDSLSVYGIAWQLDLKEEKLMAARSTLRNDWYSLRDLPKLIKTPAIALIELMEYRARCVGEAANFVWNPDDWKIFRKQREETWPEELDIPDYIEYDGPYMGYSCRPCAWSGGTYNPPSASGQVLRIEDRGFKTPLYKHWRDVLAGTP